MSLQQLKEILNNSLWLGAKEEKVLTNNILNKEENYITEELDVFKTDGEILYIHKYWSVNDIIELLKLLKIDFEFEERHYTDSSQIICHIDSY